MTRSLLRWVYPPLMLIGFNGVAIAMIASDASHILLIPLLLLAIGLSFGVERLIPYDDDWNQSHDDAERDIAHGADLGIAKQPHFPVAYLDQLVEPFRPYRAGGSR
jgi:hypothetical protein